MTTTVLNAKIGKVGNKILCVCNLVKKTDCKAKISDIEVKYCTTFNHNKFTSEIFETKTKEKGFVDKSNKSDLVKSFDLNTKLATLATKTELKAEQDKIMNLEAFD